MLVNKKGGHWSGRDIRNESALQILWDGENQVKAVNHVNIQIQQGEFVAIVGKSGSGKVPCCICWAGWIHQPAAA